MFGEFKRNSCVSGVVPCSGHFGILFVFSTLPTQRRGVNQRSILSRVQFLRGIYTALASRPVCCAVPYFASRFARTAGRTVLYPLPLSLPPTRHTVGDATRPHRVTRIDLISSFIPRIAHSSLRSERRLRRACGCAAGRPTTQELLEERCRSRFWRPVHLHIAGQLCACSAPLVQNDLVDQLLPLPPVRCEREAQSWPYVK